MILADGSTLHLVHFCYQAPEGTHASKGRPLTDSRPVWRIACTPHLTELHATGGRDHPWRRTEDPRAVSCPLCKETEQYQQAAQCLRQSLQAMRVGFRAF